MAERAIPAWPGEEWLDFVMGVSAAAARVNGLVAALVDHSAPVEDPVPAPPDGASDELLDAVLGLEVLCGRLSALLDRAAAPFPEPGPPPPPVGDLLR